MDFISFLQSHAELLIAAMADLVSNPAPAQSEVLARWARAYIGIALLNIDPELQNLQIAKIREKTFILDTDFVLGAAVKEAPEHPVFMKIIQSLCVHGVRVVIPIEVIAECVRHAYRSPRTYSYHGYKLLAMNPEIVATEVRNHFVRAYYYAIKSGVVQENTEFSKYLENYYDKDDSVTFFTDIIKANLPKEVVLESIDNISRVKKEQSTDIGIAIEKLIEVMARPTKYRQQDNRTEDEKLQLTRTDAHLMVANKSINTGIAADSDRLMWARSYIVTQSYRYATASKELGWHNVAITAPMQFIIIMENVFGPVTKDNDIVRLLENPIVNYATESMWPDIEKLLKIGVSLEGKNLIRLRRDLDKALHESLQEYQVDDDEFSLEQTIGFNEQLVMLGYKTHPVYSQLKNVMQQKDQAESNFSDLQKQFTEIESVIVGFGKKKQKYLNRYFKRAAKKTED